MKDRLIPWRSSFDYSVEAESSDSIRYQWIHQGAELVGETNAALRIAEARREHSGVYQIRVSTRGGSIRRAASPVRVLVPLRLFPPIRNADGTVDLPCESADGQSLSGSDVLWTTLSYSENPVAGPWVDTLLRSDSFRSESGRVLARIPYFITAGTIRPPWLPHLPVRTALFFRMSSSTFLPE